MSPDEKESQKPAGLLEKLIDMERIDREGPTLKVVAENMRTVLACIAMLVAITLLYTREPANLGIKIIAVLWGGWVSIYTFLALYQACFIFGIAMIGAFGKLLHPNLFRQHRDGLLMITIAVSSVMTVGAIAIVVTSVSGAFRK